MAQCITLPEAVEKLRELGFEVSFGEFDSLDAFESYFKLHYIPALRDNALKDNMASFLASDLDSLFKKPSITA